MSSKEKRRFGSPTLTEYNKIRSYLGIVITIAFAQLQWETIRVRFTTIAYKLECLAASTNVIRSLGSGKKKKGRNNLHVLLC